MTDAELVAKKLALIETLRLSKSGGRFRIEARDLGPISPGLSLDNIGELLERVESAEHR